MDDDSGFGLSHLASTPITMSFGLVLLGVLVLLIMLRLVFGNLNVSGGGGVK